MRAYPIKEAKAKIDALCQIAADGGYATREDFYAMLLGNPDIAAQGYNAFGVIFYWNDASIKLYGYREEEAIRQDLFELVLPPELHNFARDAMASARRTGLTPAPGAVDLVHKSGNPVHVYSGHLMFHWDEHAEPEFYCIDVKVEE